MSAILSFVRINNSTTELIKACGEPKHRGTLCKWAYNLTSSQKTAEIINSFAKPLRVLGIIILAYLINRIMRLFVKRIIKNLSKQTAHDKIRTFKKRTGLSKLETSETPSGRSVQRAKTIGSALRGVGTFLIFIAAVLLILQTFDIKFAPLFAGAGLIGVIVGFGAQSMIKDFLSGIYIIVEDWYGVSDVVDVGTVSGTVEQVTLRTTRVRDQYGVVWYIPNGEIVRAGNKSQQWGRALLDIGVALDTDLDFAQKVIKETADQLAKDRATSVLGEPEVLGIEEIATDRILIRVIIKTIPTAQWDIARELRLRIKAAFDKAGIVLPMPSQTITYTAAQVPFEKPEAKEPLTSHIEVSDDEKDADTDKI